ncbi:MAG: glycosyltransferase family 39 protein [Caldisphaera sp.]
MKVSIPAKEKIAFIIGLITSIAVSIMVGMSSYHIALYTGGGGYNNSYISDEIYYVDSARRILVNVFGYKGTLYPYSGETQPNYYNFEHPPLAKYIIATSIALLGDKPINWRIPSVIMASLIPLILYLGISWNKGIKWIFLGALSALIASSDKILIVMGSVALLDIYATFFLTISLIFAFRQKLLLSAAFIGLASVSKETGLFGVLALIILIVAKYGKSIESIKKILEAIIIIIGIMLITYIPLFYHFGTLYVIQQTLGGYRWDLQSRPPGPPASNPSGWLINSDPFVLSYSPILAAETSPIIEIPALVSSVSIFLSCILYKRKFCYNAGAIFYIIIFLGFWLVYAAGNHTLYSFYSVTLTPAAAVSIIEGINILMGGSNEANKNSNNTI